MDDPIPISAKVPCSASGLLTFSWGLGTELRFCEIQNPGSGDGGNNPFKSTVVWCVKSVMQNDVCASMLDSAHSCIHASMHGKLVTGCQQHICISTLGF